MSFVSYLQKKEFQLVGISFLCLFLELALIRYINSTVQVIAYFNNFLVLSAFLGLGFGSLLTRYNRNWFRFFPLTSICVIAVMTGLDRVAYRGDTAEVVYWFSHTSAWVLPVLPVVVVVFLMNFLFFVPLGYRLGFCLDQFQNRLVAYAYDLAGSILGVIGFGLMSLLRTPPLVWFLVSGGISLILTATSMEKTKRLMHVFFSALAYAIVVLFTLLPQKGIWSPYYKVTVIPYFTTPEEQSTLLGYAIAADKLRILDAFHFSSDLEQTVFQFWDDYYLLPYHFSRPGKVLILGGGAGNDATFALRQNATQVDVVEIDPVIASLGFEQHPHKPYTDSRVRVINDDARAYLRRCRETYDLIVMNALDSHHQLVGLSTLRLESFMYTVEAFRDIRKVMKPNGSLVVHLSSTREWMGQRLFWSITQAFGREPRLFAQEGDISRSVAFIYGPDEAFTKEQLTSHAQLIEMDPARYHKSKQQGLLCTDDWPHLYLSKKTIPRIYIVVLATIMAITFAAFRLLGGARIHGNVQMFFLGAGFMLLEARSITKIALLFGATWLVSAIVISAILAVIFLGNLLILRRVWIPRFLCYTGLFLSLLLGYLVPIDFILEFWFFLRILIAGIWISIPIFFASLIFSYSFRTVKNTSSAFGSNLLGVVIGGILEYSSMILGLNALYLLAILLYAMTLITALTGTGIRSSQHN